MPIISYTIQRSVFKKVGVRKKCWYYEYEHIFVDVNDAVAEFLEEDGKREQRYMWKIKKQMQDAGIRALVPLDKAKEMKASDYIEDKTHPKNRNPLEIVIEMENEKEEKKTAGKLNKKLAGLMTKKQYEAWKYTKEGYSIIAIAKILNIDESSVRERLQNAVKRIGLLNLKKYLTF